MNTTECWEVVIGKKHKSGGKYTGSHTTVIQEALELLQLLEKSEEITKISNGVITNAGRPGSPLRIAAKPLDANVHGLCVTVSKGAVHQTFRIYLSASAECTTWQERCIELGTQDSIKRGKNVRNIRQQKKDFS